jgi:integrase
MTIGRVWRRARQAAFTAEVAASPLAKTPYDLRHAAVSTWLNGGVPPTTVAEWAGHSVEVLLRIYAKSLFPTFGRLLSLALVMAMIRGHDHYRDPCS